jgi:hypothetical protein
MAKIKGLEGLTGAQVASELARGAKFVVYEWCVSIVILTFRRPSAIHFIHPGENAVSKGLGYSLISLFFGWWGIPWGPIYTIGSFITNFKGGKDITQQVLASMNKPAGGAG